MNDDKYFEHWYNLKLFLNNYRTKYSKNDDGSCADERYCVAMSIDDILKKMKEIEEKQ